MQRSKLDDGTAGPATTQEAAPDDGRRSMLAGLFGASALIGLAGCVSGDPDAPAQVADELTGTNLAWADAIGTTAAPLDLRTMAQGTSAVVIAKGFYVPGDGGGGAFLWTTDTTATDDGGTVIVSTNTPRTGCWKRLAGCKVPAIAGASSVGARFDVKWFGAKGDGTTVDHLRIQAAIDACAAAGGGTVFFPPGRYKTTNALLIKTGNLTLQGSGAASVIAAAHGTDTIVVQSAPVGTFLYNNQILDLHFDEAGKAAGRTLLGVQVAQFTAARITSTTGRNGFEFNRFNILKLSDVNLLYYRGGAGTACLRLTSGTTPTDGADVAWIRDCLFSTDFDHQSTTMKGIDIDGHVHTVNLSRVGIGWSSAEAIHVRNAVGSANVPAFITAYDLEIEFSTNECIRLDAGVKLAFTSSVLHGSFQRANVFVGSQCSNIDFTGGTSTGANQAGIAIAGQDVSVTSMRFSSNNQGAGVFPGILVGGTSRGVVVSGCRAGEVLGGGITQRYGLQVDTGATEFCVTGNNFVRNQLAPGWISAAGVNLIANNREMP